MDSFKRVMTIGAVASVLGIGSQVAVAAFEIRTSNAPENVEQTAVFDESEFSMWVDNTYRSVITYGSYPPMDSAPSFGDEMPLSDALKILAPDQWRVLRARSLDLEGRLIVSWDLQQATWIDTLKNLGERHGLQFHVDFNRKEIFVKNGRKLIFDRPTQIGLAETYPSATPGRSFDRNPDMSDPEVHGTVTATSFVNLNDEASDESVFTLKKDESAKLVMEDLALIFGYERFYWLMEDKRVQQTQTYVGDATHVMGKVVSEFYGRLCLYEADKVAAVVPRNMECPTDEQI